MTVGELIARLKEFDQTLDVCFEAEVWVREGFPSVDVVWQLEDIVLLEGSDEA